MALAIAVDVPSIELVVDTSDLTWMQSGKCLGTPDLMYPDTKAESLAAQAICRRCPVRLECLTHAVENNEELGVWGGYGEKRRRKIRQGWRTGSVNLADLI